MDSAGKRQTRPPERLLDTLFDPGNIMVPVTTASNVPTTTTISTTSTVIAPPTTSTSNMPTTPGSSSGTDTVLQKMIAQLIAETRATAKDTKETLNRKLNEYRQHTTDQFAQCVERWKLTDIRLTKVEDDAEHQKVQLTQQVVINTEVVDRLNYVESEVLSVRNDLTKLMAQYHQPITGDLSQILPPTSLASTTAHVNQPINVSAIPKPPVNLPTAESQVPLLGTTLDLSRSFFFGNQERLSDAVSEFTGQIKTVHPEQFLHQLDTYFSNLSLSPAQQLISAQRRLGGDARVWFESLIPAPDSYSNFRMLFRQRFWSSATQR